MNSSSTSRRLNSELSSKRELIALLQSEQVGEYLEKLNFSWAKKSFDAESKLGKLFHDYGWTTEAGLLSRIGCLVYGRLALHFDNLMSNGYEVFDNYTLTERKTSGKNSAIFLAHHRAFDTLAVIKFVRPGASDNLEDSLRQLFKVSLPRNIIMPSNIMDATVFDILGNEVNVKCLRFPYLEGPTFAAFLRQESFSLNPHVVSSFVMQVGSALAALEKAGAYHGDLHDKNIIVTEASSGEIEFNLIDISFDAVGSIGLKEAQNSDLENFTTLVWRLLSAQKKTNAHISFRKFVGSKAFFPIEKLLLEKVRSITELMSMFESELVYETYVESKNTFINNRFRTPGSFRLQRYEEFTDPSKAAELFEPLPELRSKLIEFSNASVSGNRGSGKSTYLAMLGFFPSVDEPLVDYREIFGVFFPCRQGDFSAMAITRDPEQNTSVQKLTNVLVLKIIRRTLEILSSAIKNKRLKQPEKLQKIRKQLNRILPPPGLISLNKNIVSEVDNYLSTIKKAELSSTAASIPSHPVVPYATAKNLIGFLEAIRHDFTELSSTRFHLLFDDAGEPNVPRAAQRTINDLLVTSNSIYCVKLSAEKHTYTYETSARKSLEVGHDLFEHDISMALFFGVGNTGITSEKVAKHFQKIVDTRLKYFSYQSHSIEDYLGRTKDGTRTLNYRLMIGSSDAYYHGWHAVWNVADRTPRTLLEIVSEIFASGEIEPDGEPRVVRPRNQDRAIRTISEKRLQSVRQISGTFEHGGRRRSLGRHLHDVATTVGSAFAAHLRAQATTKAVEAGQPLPKTIQMLGIERNDIYEISDQAGYILRKLVTFGILDASKDFISRDDRRKKTVYVLNRIYCPAFSIGYSRDDHLKLSSTKLQLLLLSPDVFRKGGTELLKNLNNTPLGGLFEEGE